MNDSPSLHDYESRKSSLYVREKAFLKRYFDCVSFGRNAETNNGQNVNSQTTRQNSQCVHNRQSDVAPSVDQPQCNHNILNHPAVQNYPYLISHLNQVLPVTSPNLIPNMREETVSDNYSYQNSDVHEANNDTQGSFNNNIGSFQTLNNSLSFVEQFSRPTGIKNTLPKDPSVTDRFTEDNEVGNILDNFDCPQSNISSMSTMQTPGNIANLSSCSSKFPHDSAVSRTNLSYQSYESSKENRISFVTNVASDERLQCHNSHETPLGGNSIGDIIHFKNNIENESIQKTLNISNQLQKSVEYLTPSTSSQTSESVLEDTPDQNSESQPEKPVKIILYRRFIKVLNKINEFETASLEHLHIMADTSAKLLQTSINEMKLFSGQDNKSKLSSNICQKLPENHFSDQNTIYPSISSKTSEGMLEDTPDQNPDRRPESPVNIITESQLISMANNKEETHKKRIANINQSCVPAKQRVELILEKNNKRELISHRVSTVAKEKNKKNPKCPQKYRVMNPTIQCNDNNTGNVTVVEDEPPKKKRFSSRSLILPPEYDANDSKWTLKYHKEEPGVKELIPGRGVYVNNLQLENCKRKARDYKELARLLLEEIFTKNALSVCSLTGAKANAFNNYEVKPGLDKHAMTVLLSFVHDYGQKERWGNFIIYNVKKSLSSKISDIRAIYSKIAESAAKDQ